MIKNDRQYRITKAQIRVFETSVSNVRKQAVPAGMDRRIASIQRRALESQLEEMAADVEEYEALKAGKVTEFEAQSLNGLPALLVKARISRGITQKELAGRLHVKEQQVQRWESNDFHGASIETLKAMADALDVVLAVSASLAPATQES
jgi:ribosome-binding protein aMBF1 (putative translation factor)